MTGVKISGGCRLDWTSAFLAPIIGRIANMGVYRRD
jgi:hypothetical protein